MRRLSNEGGFEASSRNWGRFALAAIAAVLGLAAVLWILAASGFIELRKESRAEQRVLQSVGLTSIPMDPIRFETHDSRCLKVVSGYMKDGNHFAFIAKNGCPSWLPKPAYLYHLIANGITVESGEYAFDGSKQIGPGEQREQVVSIDHGTTRVGLIQIYAMD